MGGRDTVDAQEYRHKRPASGVRGLGASKPLQENGLPFFLEVAFAQVETMRSLAQDVGTHAHAREALFPCPGFGSRQQRTADALPARRFGHDQRGQFGEGLRDQQAARFNMRKSAQSALRIDRYQHHARMVRADTIQPTQNGGRVRGITELAGQHRQWDRIVSGRCTNQHWGWPFAASASPRRFSPTPFLRKGMNFSSPFTCEGRSAANARAARKGMKFRFMQAFWAQVSPLALACACAATTLATTCETFLPVGMCRNSFGPCALECGPSTPVMRNCAFGNFSPSMPMNGMLPPSPMYAAGAPNASCEACDTAPSSQSESFGAFQPLPSFSSLNVD